MRESDVPPRGEGESRRRRLLAAGAVAIATFAVLVPASWVRWPVSEDAVEYAAIAHSWVEGRGFVNPVMMSFVLDDATPPLPGFATRAPVLPLLLAIPISLGASLRTLGIVHQAWAALIVAGMVLVARRSQSLAAAIACAVSFAWSTGWLVVSQALVTEVSAVGALLLVLATARRAARSPAGALLCAGIAVLAWLTRPNLALLVPVVWLANAFELGLREALRSRPLWLYVVASAALYGIIDFAHRTLTGFAPYAEYGYLLRSLSFRDFAGYETLSSGALEFVRTHGPGVRSALGEHLGILARVLFTPEFYPPVGWLALPALAHAFRSRDPAGFERRLSSLAGIALLVPLVLLYGPSDPRRYSIFSVAALWIAEVGFLDAVRRFALERLRRRGRPAWTLLLSPSALLALAALFVGSSSLPRIAAANAPFWREFREHGVVTRLNQWDELARGFCPFLERGAVVAAGPSPWAFHYWCGNPSMWTPNDLGSVESLHRFLAEHRPEYVLANRDQAARLMRHSTELRQLAARGQWVLYRVREPLRPSSRWNAPPPLHRLGS